MTIKDLSKEELISFEEITLYNLLYGAVAEMQKEIPPKNNDSRSVVAVYGATIIPIKRRMAALNSLITKTNIDSMIFSGGFGWQGYQPRNITIEELKIEYKKPEVQKKILKRAKAIIENCPDVKGAFIKDVLGYTDENPETLSELIIDEMYQDEGFKKSMETLYNKYKRKYVIL